MSEGGGRRPGRGLGGKQTILKTGSGGQPNGACEPWATGEGGEEAEVYPGNMGAGTVRSGWKGGRWLVTGYVGFVHVSVCRDGLGSLGRQVQWRSLLLAVDY